MSQQNILITGAAHGWGRRLAERLTGNPAFVGPAFGGSDEEVTGEETDLDADLHIIGLDVEPPDEAIKGLDFIQADVRNPLLSELLRAEAIDAVCHLAFVEDDASGETGFDINVMGTMKVLGACAEAGVQKVVLKSSMMVYGADPDNPAFLTEEHPLQPTHARDSLRHMVEIEAFCNGFRRQTPEMTLTVLRFPGILGPRLDSPLTRFLTQPLAPTLLGFDPLMQVIHEQDVISALVFALRNDIPGVFNVAAEGILPLGRVMALAARTPLPIVHLFSYWGMGLMGRLGLPAEKFWPIDPDYLRYSWVGDLTRMRSELGFTPDYTAEEALREFAGEQRLRRYVPEAKAMAYDEERLRDTIERRRRAREQKAASGAQEQ